MKVGAAATPIFLIVLAGAAVAYAYLADRGVVSDVDRLARRRDVFPSLRVDEVTHIELTHGIERMTLERAAKSGPERPDVWTMTSPRTEAADGAAVDVLLRELELAIRLRDVAAEPAEGFEAPRVLGLLRVGALEYRFALGADAPRPEGAAYFRLDGEGTYVVAQSVKVQLLRGADAYRDRTIVSLGSKDLASLAIRGPAGPGFELERHGATFRLRRSGLRVSRAAAERMLNALADARAETFVADDPADLGPDPIELTLTPSDPAQTPVVLRVGKACGAQSPGVLVVRVRPKPLAACTSTGLRGAFAVGAEALVDSSPLFAHADEIEMLRLERLEPGGPRVELARKDAGWHETAPADRLLSPDEADSANRWALALAEEQAAPRVRRATEAHFAPRVRATVTRTGSSTTEVVELSAPGSDGVVLARREDDGALLELTRAQARRFEPRVLGFRPKEVWPKAFDAAAISAVDDGCTTMPTRVVLDDHVWTMQRPSGFTSDGVAIADLTRSLANAEAAAWVADKDDGTFGFAGPGACVVAFTRTGALAGEPTRTASIRFGSDGDGGVYARTSDDDAVWVAASSLRARLSRPPIDRSGVRVDVASASRVTLSRGAARVVLERSGAELVPSRGGSDGGTAGWESALEELHAVEALHTGPAARGEGMDRPTLEIAIRTTAAEGPGRERHIVVGAESRVDDQDSYFARVSGVDATFAVPERAIAPLLAGW